MKILEFGDRGKRKIILVHGFQIPWQVWEKYIEHYKNDFHIIVPVMTGHDPETKEEFISFKADAEAVEKHILAGSGGDIYAMFGMSMGGVLAATLWQNGRLGFEKIIFDGSPLISMNPMIKAFMRSFYLGITHKAQKRDIKTLEQAAGSIVSEEYLDDFLKVIDNMSDDTITSCISGISDFRLKKDNTGSEIYYFHGTASNEALAKKTARFLKKHYADAHIKCFEGKGHCENSLLHPEIMTAELDRILKPTKR